jgi:hypothetical protein
MTDYLEKSGTDAALLRDFSQKNKQTGSLLVNATGCHVKGPIALRRRLSPVLPKVFFYREYHNRLHAEMSMYFYQYIAAFATKKRKKNHKKSPRILSPGALLFLHFSRT